MKEDGGPAFPHKGVPAIYFCGQRIGGLDATIGMTLRDYFAAASLSGMQARNSFDPGLASPEQRAHIAYLDADAMIAERGKDA